MIDVSDAHCSCKKDIWSSDAPYSAMGLDRLDTVALLSGEQVMIDIRPKEEYDGTAKDAWMNTGRFRQAKHIPASEMRERIASSGITKNIPLVLIGRGLDEELFNTARILTDLGYEAVTILTTGLWGVRWEAHNLPGRSAWDAWVMPPVPSPSP